MGFSFKTPNSFTNRTLKLIDLENLVDSPLVFSLADWYGDGEGGDVLCFAS